MDFKRTLLAAACFSLASAAHALEIKFADIHPAGYPTVVAEENMGKALTKESNGELTFKYFPGGVLGSEKEVVEQAQVGAVQMTRVSLGIVGPVVPDVNVFNLPFVFRDQAHMRKVIDGEIGDEILAKITDSEFGLVALAWMDGGTRNLYTKKPVRKLEDLKGMKIRVQGNPLFIEAFNEMGANGIAMDTGEIFSALQTGVIDGAENNPPTLLEHNHFQNAKYYTLTEHLILPEPIVMSKITWNKLTPAQQDMVKKAAKAPRRTNACCGTPSPPAAKPSSRPPAWSSSPSTKSPSMTPPRRFAPNTARRTPTSSSVSTPFSNALLL